MPVGQRASGAKPQPFCRSVEGGEAPSPVAACAQNAHSLCSDFSVFWSSYPRFSRAGLVSVPAADALIGGQPCGLTTAAVAIRYYVGELVPSVPLRASAYW